MFKTQLQKHNSTALRNQLVATTLVDLRLWSAVLQVRTGSWQKVLFYFFYFLTQLWKAEVPYQERAACMKGPWTITVNKLPWSYEGTMSTNKKFTGVEQILTRGESSKWWVEFSLHLAECLYRKHHGKWEKFKILNVFS